MNSRAFLKYYWDINLYNLPISVIYGFISGPVPALMMFCSFGIFIGFLGVRYFKENEYYMYYNLGWTKTKLIKSVWMANVLVSACLLFFILLMN